MDHDRTYCNLFHSFIKINNDCNYNRVHGNEYAVKLSELSKDRLVTNFSWGEKNFCSKKKRFCFVHARSLLLLSNSGTYAEARISKAKKLLHASAFSSSNDKRKLADIPLAR